MRDARCEIQNATCAIKECDIRYKKCDMRDKKCDMRDRVLRNTRPRSIVTQSHSWHYNNNNMAGDKDEEVMYGILFRFVISFLNLAEIDERNNQAQVVQREDSTIQWIA